MSIIKGEYPNALQYANMSRFKFESNKNFHPFGEGWEPPITWKGDIDGVDIEFIQISCVALSKEDFDFSGFPPIYNSAISYIIDAIDNALRKIMD